MIKASNLAHAVGFVRWLGGWRKALNGGWYRLFAHRDLGSTYQSVVVIRPNGTAGVVTGTAWILDQMMQRPMPAFGGFLHPDAERVTVA